MLLLVYPKNTIIMFSAIGKLFYQLNLGGSRKDAITNVAGMLGALSFVVAEASKNGLIPVQYQSWAYGLITIAGAVVGIATGKTPDLKAAEIPGDR
jgi:hypothetical protein